jgi:regulator of sirC expression with transglutaminase-like and TPR domain
VKVCEQKFPIVQYFDVPPASIYTATDCGEENIGDISGFVVTVPEGD